MDSSTKISTTTTSSSSSSKQQPPKETTPIYMKFLSFWFLIIQFITVLFSWRVYFLLFDNNKPVKKDDDNNTNNNITTTTFKDKIQNNFYSLFTDIFYLIMLIITCTLFFWRCKETITGLSNCKSTSEYKSIIWNQFYGGFIEFGSFTVLLLLKWPVIFKVYWNKGTDKEDKSTWSEIFIREFSAEKDKNGNGVSASTASSKSSSGPNIFGKDPNKSSSGASSNKRILTDDQWRHAFRVDLQNIGFEFDLNGEISKFPPTEVMEQYQKSAEFRDLILSAGSIKKSDMDQGKISEQEQSKSSKDKEKEITIEKETPKEQQEQQEEEVAKDNLDENTTTTTTTTSRKGKKGKKGKK